MGIDSNSKNAIWVSAQSLVCTYGVAFSSFSPPHTQSMSTIAVRMTIPIRVAIAVRLLPFDLADPVEQRQDRYINSTVVDAPLGKMLQGLPTRCPVGSYRFAEAGVDVGTNGETTSKHYESFVSQTGPPALGRGKTEREREREGGVRGKRNWRTHRCHIG